MTAPSTPLFVGLGFALLLAGWSLAQSAAPTFRTWTDATGRQVEAAFAGMDATTVKLQLKDGRLVDYPIAQLSAQDQAFARLATPPTPSTTATAATPAPTSNRPPAQQRSFPEKVEVSARTMEKLQLVTEEPQNRKFVYQTSSFEFTSQDKLAGSVMTEVARTFEATRELVSKLPWGIVCSPPPPLERFQAALYETREDYFNNGGPTNSGGVYDSGDMIFKIPFPSLGLERRGKTWFKNENYRNDTLVHEITHQMMHDYLPFIPKWIIEGSAEYTELMPYSAGTFRVASHKSGIKDYFDSMLQRGLTSNIGSVQAHLNMTRRQWDEFSTSSNAQITLYFRSALLVYFFNHLDGTANGEHFIRFFDAVHGEVTAMQTFFANPAVKRMPGGRFSYPSNLTPPDTDPSTAPFKHLNLLLDGRSYTELANAMVEGYRSIGIKLFAAE
jgi:hypothetical protein